MQELRIASGPMIRTILENTEIATFAMQTARVIEKDHTRIDVLNIKIKENEDFITVLREILSNQDNG
jgi:hypothetical protein